MGKVSAVVAIVLAGLVAGCQTTGERRVVDVPPAIEAKVRALIARNLEGSFAAFSHTTVPITEAKLAKPYPFENRLTGKQFIVYCATVTGRQFPAYFTAMAEASIELDPSTGQPTSRVQLKVSRAFIAGCNFNDAAPFPEIIALRAERIKSVASQPAPDPAGGRPQMQVDEIKPDQEL